MSMDGGLITALQQIVNDKSNESEINYVIAKYLLKNLYNEKMSARFISEGSNISIASITRFAQHLGYSGFSDFKKDFDLLRFDKQELQIDLKTINKNKNTTKSGSIDELHSDFINVSKAFDRFIKDIDFKNVEHLADLIHDADNVIIYSILIPGNLSLILQHMLLTAGKYVEYFPDMKHQYASSKDLSEDDLAIFISLEGSHVMNKRLTLSVIDSKATNVLITHNPEMKLSSLFNYIVPLGEHDFERSGKYKLLAFIEYLMNYYLNKYTI